MLSREYVEAELRNGGYLGVFETAVEGALQDWYQLIACDPSLMKGAIPRERATFLNRRVLERICEDLEHDTNVVITETHQTKIVTIRNEITLRFKKLDSGSRAMSIKTRRVKRLWYGNQPTLPGQFSEYINVTFGWQLSHAGSIKDILIVNEYQDSICWIIKVRDGKVEEGLPTQIPLPVFEQDNEDVFTLRLRNTERAQQISKDNLEENDSSEIEDAN